MKNKTALRLRRLDLAVLGIGGLMALSAAVLAAFMALALLGLFISLVACFYLALVAKSWRVAIFGLVVFSGLLMWGISLLRPHTTAPQAPKVE